jgi:hypothetical protein
MVPEGVTIGLRKGISILIWICTYGYFRRFAKDITLPEMGHKMIAPEQRVRIVIVRVVLTVLKTSSLAMLLPRPSLLAVKPNIREK